MTVDFADIIRRLSRPLAPQPTVEQPRLQQLPGIRAVFFDVYGTMLISGSGDVGTAMEAKPSNAFVAAMTAVGLEFAESGDIGVGELISTITEHHERARRNGVSHPEVGIVEVWRETLETLQRENLIERAGDIDLQQLAVEYEARANPVWPMPGLEDCLLKLRLAEKRLGIVSNAQFYTPILFPALLGRDLDALGFQENLRFFSFHAGRAKPDCYLYELARNSLAGFGITATEVVYVGNDMLNDITPAQQVGFCTALFAGDARSLRQREADERVKGIIPDLVLTDLSQLADCV